MTLRLPVRGPEVENHGGAGGVIMHGQDMSSLPPLPQTQSGDDEILAPSPRGRHEGHPR